MPPGKGLPPNASERRTWVARGKEVYRGKPQPDFATVVESLDDKLDKTLTFDREVPLWKE